MTTAIAIQNPHVRTHEPILLDLIYQAAENPAQWAELVKTLYQVSCTLEETKVGSIPPETAYLLNRLMPHLDIAIDINHQISNVQKTNGIAQVALDNLPYIAGFVNQAGRIIVSNKLSKDFERQSNWVWQHEIGALLSSDDELVLRNLSNSFEEHSLYFMEIGENGIADNSMFAYFVLPTVGPDIDITLLQKLYDLTPAESKVANALIRKKATKDAAKELGITQNTFKDYKKSLYRKMSVNKQTSLIKKVLCSSYQLSFNELDSFKTSMHENEVCKFRLSDGRQLSYQCYGPPHGDVILLFHNTAGSALEPPLGSVEFIETNNIQLIVPERPGYGESTPQKNRTIKNHCEDIEELLNLLGVKRFSILGRCGGTPYALACANHFRDKVIRVGIASGAPRAQDVIDNSENPLLLKVALGIFKQFPNMATPLYKISTKDGAEAFFKRQLLNSSGNVFFTDLDRSWYLEKYVLDHVLGSIKRSLNQGISAWVDELNILFNDWDFDVADIRTEHIFWHGDKNPVISIPMIKNLASDIHNSHIEVLPGESHFLFERHFETIYSALVAK